MDKLTRNISRNSGSNSDKKITRISLKFKVNNVQGTINITDLMLQTGTLSTLWNSHPSEVRWSFGQ